MRKLWVALLFMAGGVAHEWRNPAQCHSITVSATAGAGKRRRLLP
jgi:hypothetical protein